MPAVHRDQMRREIDRHRRARRRRRAPARSRPDAGASGCRRRARSRCTPQKGSRCFTVRPAPLTPLMLRDHDARGIEQPAPQQRHERQDDAGGITARARHQPRRRDLLPVQLRQPVHGFAAATPARHAARRRTPRTPPLRAAGSPRSRSITRSPACSSGPGKLLRQPVRQRQKSDLRPRRRDLFRRRPDKRQRAQPSPRKVRIDRRERLPRLLPRGERALPPPADAAPAAGRALPPSTRWPRPPQLSQISWPHHKPSPAPENQRKPLFSAGLKIRPGAGDTSPQCSTGSDGALPSSDLRLKSACVYPLRWRAPRRWCRVAAAVRSRRNRLRETGSLRLSTSESGSI